jgi:endo-1,4-beta-xylanase
MWGFWEGANWIPQLRRCTNGTGLPRPLQHAYKNLIFKTWWTTGKGKTTRQGNYSMPAFYGKYKVTVNGEMKTVDLTKAVGKYCIFGKAYFPVELKQNHEIKNAHPFLYQ